jgi:glycosyltransferase involved in cell wall biosynthesis
VGGLGEVVKNGMTGYVIPDKNIEDVYSAIIDVKKTPITVDNSVLKDFNWDSSADKYLRLFREVNDGK